MISCMSTTMLFWKKEKTTMTLNLILIVDHLEDDLCHKVGHSEGTATGQSHPQN